MREMTKNPLAFSIPQAAAALNLKQARRDFANYRRAG